MGREEDDCGSKFCFLALGVLVRERATRSVGADLSLDESKVSPMAFVHVNAKRLLARLTRPFR